MSLGTDWFINIQTTGLIESIERLKQFTVLYPMKVAEALKIEGEAVMKESKREVPVDTGALKSTGYVAPVVFSHRGMSIELSYGNRSVAVNPKNHLFTTEYGIVVHEINKPHKIGKWKYLEDPVLRDRNSLYENLNNTINTLLP